MDFWRRLWAALFLSGNRRYVALAGPSILVGISRWLAPIILPQQLAESWSPPGWLWWDGALLGLLLAMIAAWDEQAKKNKLLAETGPRIVLAEHPIETAPFDVTVNQQTATRGVVTIPIARGYTALRVRMTNQPLVNTERGNTRLYARVSFFDSEGNRLIVMDGRWSDSVQMAHRDITRDYVEELSAPFSVGPHRSLDICFQRPGEDFCVAVNNDNFNNAYLAMPGRELRGIVSVAVELSGQNVSSTINFSLDCATISEVGEITITDNMPH